ncbi:Holliday junction resolvase RuvX [Desulfitibacter alkalitolerans]|uniref:Holliday junction resolvase RuvX n=1 Tax=Desulfitibacter alkalitolerans TaxID=264641 RepID=UPI000557DC47|nr:Holliday junction resolvase RuvX [Desulfitibacter alkalitolerans]
MARIAGLDIGERTIGIAVSDLLGITAQGLDTVKRSCMEEDLKQIISILKDYDVTFVVVGLPKNMNNTLGPSADRAKEFGNELAKRTGLEIKYWDERLTTVSAQRTLLEGDVSRKKRKQVVDKIAAVMILQNYMDSTIR